MNETISKHLKERFCKDYKLSIRVFDEPYFMERLVLVDRIQEGIIEKFVRFCKEVAEFGGEQGYLAEYNKVKDKAIDFIKDTSAYKEFNNMDMNKFKVNNTNLPRKDIYKPEFDGQTFISIDIKKANFSCLRAYDASIVGNAASWEEFISRFTTSEHIKESKYIRQVIFGNCNCSRHITYEKYIMDNILTNIDKHLNIMKLVVFFSNDEIVLRTTDLSIEERKNLEDNLKKIEAPVDLRVESFELHKIEGVDGYYKKFADGTTEFKGLNTYTAAFVYRTYLGEPITENDKVFWHEGMLAKFIDIPEIKIDDIKE